MDNASIHHSPNITKIYSNAGVLLVYLSPYSPDLNPIEEFFAEVKAFIKKEWHVWEQDQAIDFAKFFRWCILIVGSRQSSAKGHFRHAGITVEKA